MLAKEGDSDVQSKTCKMLEYVYPFLAAGKSVVFHIKLGILTCQQMFGRGIDPTNYSLNGISQIVCNGDQ